VNEKKKSSTWFKALSHWTMKRKKTVQKCF
jgi:hypothetical protein